MVITTMALYMSGLAFTLNLDRKSGSAGMDCLKIGQVYFSFCHQPLKAAFPNLPT